jgi:hypothetical protein
VRRRTLTLLRQVAGNARLAPGAPLALAILEPTIGRLTALRGPGESYGVIIRVGRG